MSDDGYVPATVVRCTTCGGVSTLTHPEPQGRRYACPHHGVGDGDEGPFEVNGVGQVGDEFEVSRFHVLDAHEGDVPKVHPPEPPLSGVRETRFDDYEAVVVRGHSPAEQARERGVTGGTVRSNVADAREVFDA
jgi:hypothetical protein